LLKVHVKRTSRAESPRDDPEALFQIPTLKPFTLAGHGRIVKSKRFGSGRLVLAFDFGLV